MRFDYPNNKFIEDGKTNRLLVDGFSFIVQEPVTFAARFAAGDQPPGEEDGATIVNNIEFAFEDGILKIYAGGKRLRDLSKLLFIMSESEVSAAQEQMYRRTMDSTSDAIEKRQVFEPGTKMALQKCIERLGEANGVVLPENINFFNDKLLLYMFPLLRVFSNSSTNFYKVLEDMRFTEEGYRGGSYTLTPDVLEQRTIGLAVQKYLGTASKEITKFVANNIVRKTDLVKSLSPQLLDILMNHSGKIFRGTIAAEPNVKILTCYEDIMFEALMYTKFAMDIFDNNVDHVQTLLKNVTISGDTRMDRNAALFLRENLTPKKIFNVMNGEQNYLHTLTDVQRQFDEYKDPKTIPWKLRTEYPNGLELPKKWQTLKELHDKVSADYNKIKAEDNNKTIEYSPTEFMLHGMVKDNIELMLPSEASKLVEWGRDQSHCVASYADRAAAKSCIIMGVKVDGVHTYTLELRTHEHIRPKPLTPQTATGLEELPPPEIERESVFSCEIVQFRGVSNSNPDPKHREVVREMLSEVFIAGIGGARDTMAFMNNDANDALQYALQYNQAHVEVPDRNLLVRNVAVE